MGCGVLVKFNNGYSFASTFEVLRGVCRGIMCVIFVETDVSGFDSCE